VCILRFLNSLDETAEKISHNAISSLYRLFSNIIQEKDCETSGNMPNVSQFYHFFESRLISLLFVFI